MGYTELVPAMVAAIGGCMYGIDTGIVATTIGHETFNTYMFGPSGKSTSLTGAIVSVYNAGQCVGTFMAGWSSDKFSRKRTISLACLIAIVGIILQTAAVNVGMFITGRLLTGWSSGMLLPIVPVYIAELSPPNQRGVIVGFQGMSIAIGFCASNWIGYGGAFATGNLQWRIPLAMQFPMAFALLIGSFFIPYSPRWLISKNRFEEARAVLQTLHKKAGSDFANQEFIQIREQVSQERAMMETGWLRGFMMLFSKQYLRRTLLSCFILALTQFSGSGVVQNFQNIFYASVGFTGRKALLISGIYGFMGVIGQIMSLVFVADRWRRTTTLWVGCIVLAVMLSVCMALSAEFGGGGNQAAARATIAFIFIYSASYAIFFNSTTWVVCSELMPLFIRSTGLSFATFVQGVSGIALSQISPVALASISWKYYSVFIASNMVGAAVYAFLLPDTMGKSLEEITELFGGTLATDHLGEIDVMAKQDVVEVEHAVPKPAGTEV